MMHRSLLRTLALAGTLQAVGATTCSCGYYDSATEEIYTDSIIVYFNETNTIPDNVFYAQSFSHEKEIGWNSLYRQGAVESNAVVGKTPGDWTDTLQLYIDPSTTEHLVDGGAIESRRQDILHGTFRASMRSSGQWTGGSALSMMLYQNYSSSIEIDMLNTDAPVTARVTTLVNGEYPSNSLAVNYTVLEAGSSKLAAIDPWDFCTVRIDWTKKRLNFTVADNTTRSVTSSDESFPTEPLPLIFKHWSTGDSEWMQGPPVSRTVANVEWVRAFFNSSLTTAAEIKSFDEQCQVSDACDVDDMSLRNSSSYSADALIKYKPKAGEQKWRIPAAIASGSSAFFGIVALINVLFRRTPWRKLFGIEKLSPKLVEKPAPAMSEITMIADAQSGKDKTAFTSRTASMMSTSTLGSINAKSKWDKTWTPSGSAPVSSSTTPRQMHSPTLSRVPSEEFDLVYLQENRVSHADFASSPTIHQSPSTLSMGWSSNAGTMVNPTPELRSRMTFSPTPIEEWKNTNFEQGQPHGSFFDDEKTSQANVSARKLGSSHSSAMERPGSHGCRTGNEDEIKVIPSSDLAPKGVNGLGIYNHTSVNPASVGPSEQLPAKAKPRIDYLAGLVTVSCLGVTFIHFTLTFIPYAGGLSTGWHYKSEYWARWTVSPVILDPIWLGPFFVTSCRFLVQKYVRTGNLLDVAEKVLLRAPRMLTPCIIIAALEYFFIEEGATTMLEWLPSISWSSWVYVSNYPNFGYFINEALELAYLIPNQAPQIVTHYCVGVLWTIPVQLQSSYTTLLAIVMVKEMKSPWKRFAFYTFCIANNWYALNWGSCFWMGAMLADLHLTYNYTKWIQARPLFHYPLIFVLWCLIISAPLFSLLEDRLAIPVMTRERGLHPDPSTGLPNSQTKNATYPAYYEPRANTLIFAFALQMLAEISTWTQTFLSFRLWIWIFPHTFTIYLIHGFIFWSFGSWFCISLSDLGLPYWAIMLLVWTCCYSLIAIAAILLTPLTEGTALAVSRNVWRWATEEPVPKRPTLSPFRKDLFLDRAAAPGAARTSADMARRVSMEDVEAHAHGVPEMVEEVPEDDESEIDEKMRVTSTDYEKTH